MFYIVAKGTGLIVTDGPNRTRAYKTFGAARATRTRLCNKAGWSVSELNIVDTKHYQAPMVERTNLGAGGLVPVAAAALQRLPPRLVGPDGTAGAGFPSDWPGGPGRRDRGAGRGAGRLPFNCRRGAGRRHHGHGLPGAATSGA